MYQDNGFFLFYNTSIEGPLEIFVNVVATQPLFQSKTYMHTFATHVFECSHIHMDDRHHEHTHVET